MSELDELKDTKTKKRKLKKVSVHEISYTSGLGAASGLNEAFLFKDLDGTQERELSDEEKLLLKKLGKEDTPTSKSPTSGLDEQGDVNINKEKGNDEMSEKLEAQVAELTKKLAISEAKSGLGKYSFDDELTVGVATALASLGEECKASVLKALDYLVDCSEYAVAVAKSAAPVESEQNELQKQLSEEAGKEDFQEPVQKTRAEVIEEKTAEIVAKGGK